MQAIIGGLQNRRDPLEVGALSLGIILFIVLLLQPYRTRSRVYRPCRGLYKDSVSPVCRLDLLELLSAYTNTELGSRGG